MFVEDASTDSTGDALDELTADLPGARVVRHEVNLGLSAARNTGLAHADGTYLAWLDADDWIGPGYLDQLVRVIERRADGLVAFEFSIGWPELAVELMLPALDDPLPAFREVHRTLQVDGLFMFSTLGPDTLRELRAVLPAAAGERVHRFIDMHDLGDALVQAGFTDPVMDMEIVTLTYPDLDTLLQDLRRSGGANAATSRPRGLSGRQEWAEARAAYERLRRDGRLPATFEVIQGHAWKAAPKTTDDGRSIVRFQPRPPAR